MKVYKITYTLDGQEIQRYFSTATKAFDFTTLNKIRWFSFEEITMEG